MGHKDDRHGIQRTRGELFVREERQKLPFINLHADGGYGAQDYIHVILPQNCGCVPEE